MVEWELGQRIVLEPNDEFYLEPKPAVSQVTYFLSGGSPLVMYENDELDITGIGANDIERIRDPNEPLNSEFHEGDSLDVYYIGFNTQQEPFDDPKVRQAFGMAIDKNQIVTAIFHDALPVAEKIVMPGMPSYNEGVQGPGFDPERAQQLLEESSYGGPEDLPEITFAESGTGATGGADTSAIVEMWRTNLGVEVQIQQAESATFFQDIADGRYQAFHLGWIMDYPDEENLLNIHFDSESPNNDTFYSNAEVDDLLRRAQTEPDVATRNQLYNQAEQIVLNDAPWIPMFFSRYHQLIKPYVQNYQVPAAVVPRLRFVTLLPH
jgi:ABC-type transport system substrate-binding protein